MILDLKAATRIVLLPYPPKVFVSYTHDSREHDQRVLNLSERLRSSGFDADLDQYHVNKSWPVWMEKQIAEANFVLIICTETYLRRWDGNEQPDKGLGAQWESKLTRQSLYENPQQNEKFIPVVFESADLAFIPQPLRDVTRIVLANGFQTLVDRLNNVSPAAKPPVRTSLLPIGLAPGFFSTEGASIELQSGTEELISNLFPVSTPPEIQVAKILRRLGAKGFHNLVNETWSALGKVGSHDTAYIIDGSMVFSFEPFTGELWEDLIRRKRIQLVTPIKTSDWANSKIQGDTSRFVKLLNQALRRHCFLTESPFPLIYSKAMDCYLFKAKDGVSVGLLGVKALKTNARRMVFKAIPDKFSAEPGKIQHWQHEAFRHRWSRFGEKWYLVITPFWAFTSDGVSSSSRFQKTSSANMRKPERNRAVLGHVLFWRSVLCRAPDLIRGAPTLNIEGSVRLNVSPSICDADWMKVAKDDEGAALMNDHTQQLLL